MKPFGVRVLDDVIPNVNKVVEYVKELGQWKGSATLSTDSSHVISEDRTSKTVFVPMLSWRNDPLIHEMNRAVWAALDQYANDFSFSFSGIEDVSIQKYEVGDFYKPHTDAGANTPRVVSAVAYLNTVESGGETRFCNFDYSVSPVAGRLAIFPSDYIYRHEALTPKSGIKIAAAYWATH